MGLPFLQGSALPSVTEPRSRRGPRILVVDDSEIMLELVEAILSDRGVEVLRARNAPEARRVVDRNPPDLVLTDLQMPGGSGVELLEWLREHHGNVPGLLMTAAPEAAPPRWVSRLIEKPFCCDELWARIRRSLGEDPSASAGG